MPQTRVRVEPLYTQTFKLKSFFDNVSFPCRLSGFSEPALRNFAQSKLAKLAQAKKCAIKVFLWAFVAPLELPRYLLEANKASEG